MGDNSVVTCVQAPPCFLSLFSSSLSKTATNHPKLYSRASQAPKGVGPSVSKNLSSEIPDEGGVALAIAGCLPQQGLPGSHAQNAKGVGGESWFVWPCTVTVLELKDFSPCYITEVFFLLILDPGPICFAFMHHWLWAGGELRLG